MDAQSPSVIYGVSSVGISSKCVPVGQDCQLNPDSLTYNCSSYSVSGDFAKTLSLGYKEGQHSSASNVSWLAAVNLRMNGSTLLSNSQPGAAVSTHNNGTLLTILSCSSRVTTSTTHSSMASPP